jgi:hypothetical protein
MHNWIYGGESPLGRRHRSNCQRRFEPTRRRETDTHQAVGTNDWVRKGSTVNFLNQRL